MANELDITMIKGTSVSINGAKGEGAQKPVWTGNDNPGGTKPSPVNDGKSVPMPVRGGK